MCIVSLEATNFSSNSVDRIDSDPLRTGFVTAIVERCGEFVVALVGVVPMLVLRLEGDSLPMELVWLAYDEDAEKAGEAVEGEGEGDAEGVAAPRLKAR